MNYIALNQNIFGKSMIIGQGFVEGTDINPIRTFSGFEVYLNGRHKFPKPFGIDELFLLGKIRHPYVQTGMPDASGELTYELGICEDAYIILIHLKIDEIFNGKSEAVIDALAFIKRDDFPSNIEDNERVYWLVSTEMMLCHFDKLFEFLEKKEDLEDWEFEGDFINEIIDEYFEGKGDLKH